MFFNRKPKPQDFSVGAFMSLAQQIMDARGDDDKLRLCEQGLPSLPSFVAYCIKTDGELPPSVPCRDYAPELYMRRGEWEKAEHVIRLCVSVGAYGYTEYRNSRDRKGHWVSETGEAEIATLQNRRSAALAVLAFLRESPGALQKNIYKIPALAAYDHDALVWFCRWSRQIRKEKYQNTNRLYALEEGVYL